MRQPLALLATVASDSHMWNLWYLRLLLEELGFDVACLGCCTPAMLVQSTISERPVRLIVISTVNGCGAVEGARLIQHLVQSFGPSLPPVVVGGKLATSVAEEPIAAAHLMSAGCSAVFFGPSAVDGFRSYIRSRFWRISVESQRLRPRDPGAIRAA